jgi:beta-fructofuranosidase
MCSTLHHPNRYVWDFWYYYDSKTKIFHIFYLNADPVLVPDGKHHYASQVGYGFTKDFFTMEWGPYDVFSADPNRWDNTSIWTGDVIRIKDGFLLFYTSRNSGEDDGHTQNIGLAYADRIDARRWEPVPGIRIKPDGSIYEPRYVPGDCSIHAWRDPFLFRHNNQIYMLISAKAVKRHIWKNGTIGLLHSQDSGFRNWEILKPIADPGFYSEMEVSQLLLDKRGRFNLVYSTSPEFDNAPNSSKAGGLHYINSPDLNGFNQNPPHVLLPFDSGLYACRIIPEMGGEIVGFDHRTGGIKRSGIKTGFRHINRDFSDCSLG